MAYFTKSFRKATRVTRLSAEFAVNLFKTRITTMVVWQVWIKCKIINLCMVLPKTTEDGPGMVRFRRW